MLGRVAELVETARAAEGESEPYVVLRPEEQGFSVVREGEHEWRINGRPAERAVALADLTNAEAMTYVQQRLRRMGVERALVRAGVSEGDVVRIGKLELTYEEERRVGSETCEGAIGGYPERVEASGARAARAEGTRADKQ